MYPDLFLGPAAVKLGHGKSSPAALEYPYFPVKTTLTLTINAMPVTAAEVVIIGAGVSGLKAANVLLEKLEPHQVLILESDSRVGGRLKTDTTSSKVGLTYDLGASWYHDALSNCVLQELSDDCTIDWNKDVYYDDKDSAWYDEHGLIDVNSLKLNRVFEELEKYIEMYFFENTGEEDVSLQEIVNKYIEKYEIRLTPEQIEYIPRMIRYFELWYGITWDNISGKYAIMEHEGRNLYNLHGYQMLVDKLSSKIEGKIMLNQQVVSVTREGSMITLRTANGLRVLCKNLIVTVPLSILQANVITWEPSLPKRFRESLATMHWGALGKVIFEFNEVWWDDTEDRFDIIAKSNVANPGQTLTSLPPSFSYPAHVINCASKDRPIAGPALIILTQAPLTNYLEANPNQAWDYFKPMLSSLKLANKSVTDPINTITSDWTQNPNIRGSYSALYTNDDANDIIIQLSGDYPEFDVFPANIRFAGEHTILEGSGCVHGAYASGARAAKYILNNYS